MQERNLLNAGEFVEPLPLGLPAILEYDETGRLVKAKLGFTENSADSKILYTCLLNSNLVPARIDTKGGSCYIKGVLYTGKVYKNSFGEIPEVLIGDILGDLSYGCQANFFAGQMTSTSISFLGISQIRTWLQNQQFNLLPGFVMPSGDPEFAARKFVESTVFDFDEIIGYFVFSGKMFTYYFLKKRIERVSNISIYLDESGYVHSDLELDTSANCNVLHTSYYQVLADKIYSDDRVLLNEDYSVIKTYGSLVRPEESFQYSCPGCGKFYTIEDEFSRCPDERCVTRMYPDLQHFINRLNLPNLTYEAYREAVENGTIKKFYDIFKLDMYSARPIETTLYDALDAIIPVHAIRNRTEIWDFYSALNNSFDTLSYYLDNPQVISLDLNVNVPQLVEWLSDSENAQLVNILALQSNMFTYTADSKKFDGSPIFRDKSVYLTGTFLHGSKVEVSSILASYGATVTANYDEADCGILGDIPEDINGKAINTIRSKNLKVFTESEFFNMYDIDSDL